MKILIGDHHTFFREGLRAQLSHFENVREIHEIICIEDILFDAGALSPPDILFIDREILEPSWKATLAEVIKCYPSSHVVLLSISENVSEIWEAFSLGIHGFITKYSPDAQNINALRLIIEGIPYVPPVVLKGLPLQHKIKEDFPLLPSGHRLTGRQREVLNLLSIGMSNKEIAHKIKVSEATVKLHINALLRHLQVENRTKAVVTAQKIGII